MGAGSGRSRRVAATAAPRRVDVSSLLKDNWDMKGAQTMDEAWDIWKQLLLETVRSGMLVRSNGETGVITQIFEDSAEIGVRWRGRGYKLQSFDDIEEFYEPAALEVDAERVSF